MGKRWNKIKQAGIKIGAITGLTLAGLFGFSEISKAQNPQNAIQYLGNPFAQPTDPEKNKNWQGSGDVNNDNIVNQNDVSRIEQVINGTYTNPSDRRLMNRADVNWDGSVNNTDKQILQEYVNGTRDHLIGYWNELETREEKEELLQKFVERAKLTEICEGRPPSECNCNQRSEVTMLLTNRWSQKDITRFLEFDSEYQKFIPDTNLFNLPVMQLDLQDSDGKFGHAYNTIVMGDNALIQGNRCDIEPEFGLINSPVRSHSGDAMVWIRGPPTMEDYVSFYTDLGAYFYYTVTDFIPSDAIYLHEEYPSATTAIPAITQREDNNPEIDIISPEEKKVYNYSPNLEANISDENVYDRYNLGEDGVTKNYYNPHNSIKLNSTTINNNQIFNYTNRSLENITGEELEDGNYQLVLRSKDALGNESSETRNFTIDKTNPEIFVYKPVEDSTYTEKNIEFNYKLVDANIDTKKENTHYKLNGSIGYFSNYSEGTIPVSSREGENKLEIIAKDLAGNQSTKTITYTYTPKTGIEDVVSEDEISAFPNPSHSLVNFKFENPMGEDREIELYSPSGQLVGGKKTNGELLEYDISKYPYGFLIYRVLDENKKTIGSGKIVRE